MLSTTACDLRIASSRMVLALVWTDLVDLSNYFLQKDQGIEMTSIGIEISQPLRQNLLLTLPI